MNKNISVGHLPSQFESKNAKFECNDNEFCHTSLPPPPPAPNGREDLWDLQYCRLWGWNWTRNRNNAGKVDSKIMEKHESRRNVKVKPKKRSCLENCLTCCISDEEEIPVREVKPAGTEVATPKQTRKSSHDHKMYRVHKVHKHHKSEDNHHWLTENEHSSEEELHPAIQRVRNAENEANDCRNCCCCMCAHVPMYHCCHCNCQCDCSAVKKPKKRSPKPICNCETQTFHDVAIRCTQTTETPPPKRCKCNGFRCCPRRACCCCPHWCAFVPCPQCCGQRGVRCDCGNKRRDLSSSATDTSSENIRKSKKKCNSCFLAQSTFAPPLKSTFADLIDPKDEIQYLNSLSKFERSNNEHQLLLNRIYDILFMTSNTVNNSQHFLNDRRNKSCHSVATPRQVNFLDAFHSCDNLALINNFMEKYFNKKEDVMCARISKSAKEIGVNTEDVIIKKEESRARSLDFENNEKQDRCTHNDEGIGTGLDLFDGGKDFALSKMTFIGLPDDLTAVPPETRQDCDNGNTETGECSNEQQLNVLAVPLSIKKLKSSKDTLLIQEAKKAVNRCQSNAEIAVPTYTRTGLLCHLGSNYFRTLKSPSKTHKSLSKSPK